MSDTPENTGKVERKLVPPQLTPWTGPDGDNPRPVSPGRPKLSDEEKAARKAARREIVRWQNYKNMTVEQLKALDLNALPLVDVLMIRRLKKDLNEMDTAELHRMYARQLGAPKQDADVPSGLTLENGKVVITIVTGKPPDEDGSRTAD